MGLTRFDRTIVLAGRDLVVVYDRLAATEPQAFSWLLHHFGQVTHAGAAWTIVRNQAQLTVLPLMPVNLVGEASTYRPQFIHPTRNLTPKEPDINLLELRTEPLREATFLVPLLIGDQGSTPPPVQNLSDATRAALRVGDTVVCFNQGAGEMMAPTPWGEQLKTKARAVVARLQDGKHQVVSMEAK